jgi:hypothetical protein
MSVLLVYFRTSSRRSVGNGTFMLRMMMKLRKPLHVGKPVLVSREAKGAVQVHFMAAADVVAMPRARRRRRIVPAATLLCFAGQLAIGDSLVVCGKRNARRVRLGETAGRRCVGQIGSIPFFVTGTLQQPRHCVHHTR